MSETFLKLLDLLDKRERRNAVLLFIMMLLMGLLEVLGVASVMPFIAVLANPEVIQTNHYLNFVYTSLGFDDSLSFLIFLGSVVFILVVGSLGFKALTTWVMTRYAQMRNFSLSSRLMRGYLNRPYSFFLNRHSADLGKSILSEVAQVIKGSLIPAIELVANTIVAILIIMLVVVVDPLVALFALAVLGGAYAATYVLLRKRLAKLGEDRVRVVRQRFQITQEAFGGIKDVKVLGLENGYLRSFRNPASRLAVIIANHKLISEIPQFAMQAIAFGCMLILLLALLITREGDLGAVLPLIGLYAFAGSRLNPALQALYRAFTSLRFGKPALDLLHSDLATTESIRGALDTVSVPDARGVVHLNSELRLENVTYTYPLAPNPALVDFSLTIPAKVTVGLVGTTGAGKTTAVDLILGLLVPDKGQLKVDGKSVTGNNLRSWQRNLGYVPQHIFLTDDTVAANIAFGVKTNEIDQQAVERAARIAELHDFVNHDLPSGYQTLVGERGVRLSGGQRQRIGIARALYRDPDLLVLDEATSALDNLTEKVVMEAVHNLGHRKTIIIIAHRLSTVKECDTIFLLEQGRLKASGTFSELAERDQHFSLMAAGLS